MPEMSEGPVCLACTAEQTPAARPHRWAPPAALTCGSAAVPCLEPHKLLPAANTTLAAGKPCLRHHRVQLFWHELPELRAQPLHKGAPPHCTPLAGRSRSLRAAAPKHSFVWNQPRQPSVNAGSFWQQLIPHPGCPTCLGLQPRVACSRCWLLLRPWHLRHLELTWILSGPQQGAQLCSQPELPERHLLTAPAERPGSQGAGERRAPSPAGLGHSWPSPRKGKNGEQRAAPAAPWTRCSPRVPSNSAVL